MPDILKRFTMAARYIFSRQAVKTVGQSAELAGSVVNFEIAGAASPVRGIELFDWSYSKNGAFQQILAICYHAECFSSEPFRCAVSVYEIQTFVPF